MGTLFRLRTNGKYIYGWVILKTQRRKQTDNRTGKKEKKEEERRIGRQGPSTTRRKGDYRLLQCGVGDCLCAKASILVELCCKRVDWQPTVASRA